MTTGAAAVRFDGRTVLVTGAGSGLGRAHALLLARLGACVVVNDLPGTPSSADAVVAQIRQAGGQAVAATSLITTPVGAAALVETALSEFGRLDAVVNNAGNLRDRTLAKLTADELDDVLDVHLRGTVLVSQAAFRVFRTSGYGRLVHTTSAAGLFGNYGQSAYAAAKAGVVGLSRVIAEEGARHGVLSNVVAPLARTPMMGDLLGTLAQRLDPEKVSPVVAYLASEQCQVTREVLSAGGGRIARVVTGVTPGWFAGPTSTPTADEVAAHLPQILDLHDLTVPTNATDEVFQLAALLEP